MKIHHIQSNMLLLAAKSETFLRLLVEGDMCGNEFLVQRSNRFWVGNQVLTVKRKREEYQANCVMSSDTRQLMMPSEFESIASTSSLHSEMAKI